jgi:uncharacterized protein (TIGR02145 family)
MKKSILTLIIFIGSFLSFSQESGTFTDTRDGKVYKTVKIGSQTWMAENLAFNADSNCWVYNNNKKNVPKFGYLYNGKTAQKICPSGWHLPSKEEFETLLNNCGGSAETAYKALLPGGSSGFSILFGGGQDINIGEIAPFWSSSLTFLEEAEEDIEVQWALYIKSKSSKAYMHFECSIYGFSVRCLKDN